MQAQEDEISTLRRQLDSMQVASSRARAGGAGRRQYDGSVPAEYICPITQVIDFQEDCACKAYVAKQ